MTHPLDTITRITPNSAQAVRRMTVENTVVMRAVIEMLYVPYADPSAAACLTAPRFCTDAQSPPCTDPIALDGSLRVRGERRGITESLFDLPHGRPPLRTGMRDNLGLG
jgi:hypothetical protein